MSAAGFGSIKFAGLDEIRNTLRKLPEETQKKVLAVALKRAAEPLVKAAKTLVPKRTGALRNSISFLVKKGKRGDSYAVVGPARGQFKAGKRLRKGADATGADQPANYAYLVEFGHHSVMPTAGTSRRKKTAREVRFIPAKPFMRPALISAHGAVRDGLAAGVSEGLQKALARIVKNPAARG